MIRKTVGGVFVCLSVLLTGCGQAAEMPTSQMKAQNIGAVTVSSESIAAPVSELNRILDSTEVESPDDIIILGPTRLLPTVQVDVSADKAVTQASQQNQADLSNQASTPDWTVAPSESVSQVEPEPIEPPNPTEPSKPTEPPPTPSTHTHQYVVSTVAPTCTEQGYTLHTCECGECYKDGYTAALGHSYAETVVPPTTAAQGYTEHTCTRCGDSYRDCFTERLVEVIDLWEIIDYGLAYAEGLGYTVDRSMTLADSSYFPGYCSNMKYYPDEVTMDFLKRIVLNEIDCTTNWLIAGGDTIPGFRLNVYASYDLDFCGEYYIVILYG